MNLKSLISEDGENISMGRVAFWLLFLISILFWTFEPIDKFPPTLFDTFMSMVIYNFGKKGVDVFNNYVSLKGK